ncbi:hypothetical protein BH09MYX1_BH09MYX1_61570 [soil metagenome]
MSALIDDWRGHGIRITHAVVHYDETKGRHVESNDDVVRLHFGLRGDYSVRYPELGRSFDLAGGHHNVFYAPHFQMDFVNKTTTLETFGIQFAVDAFIGFVDGSNDELTRFCERLRRRESAILFEEWAPLTPALETTIHQIRTCEQSAGGLNRFPQAKGRDLPKPSECAAGAWAGSWSSVYRKNARGDRVRADTRLTSRLDLALPCRA